MPFELYAYSRVADIVPALRALPPVSERIFLVAASGDRELLAHMLEGTQWSYRVRRWDEIYRSFSERLKVPRPRVQIDPPDHWLVLSELLRRSCARVAGLPQGVGTKGFLKILASQIHELIREEVPPSALEGLFGERDAVGRLLIDVYKQYMSVLEKRNLSDSRGITTETRRLLDMGGAGELCRSLEMTLVGFSSFTHSQLLLLRALEKKGAKVRVYAPVSGLEEGFGAARQLRVGGVSLSKREPFAVTFMEGGDPRQEFENAARCLTLWEQGRGPLAETGEWLGWDNVAASVPASCLGTAREVFTRYGLPVRWNCRLKVTQTPLWQMVTSCLDASAGGWQTDSALRLLASPWLSGFSIDAHRLLSLRPRGEKSWSSALFTEAPSCTDDFKSCAAFVAALDSGGTALELLTALRVFAGERALAVARRIADSPDLDESLAVFSETLRELDRKILFLREFVRDIGEFGERRLKGADARAYLEAWADGTTVALGHPEADCMDVFTDAPPPLFSSPYWFVFGADAARWPGNLRESPVLDETRKERLHESNELGLDLDISHLPLLAEQRAQREFLFRRLLACGERVTFVCHSSTDDQDRPLERTSLLASAERDGWVKVAPKNVVRRLDGLLAAADEDALVPLEARSPDLRREHMLPSARTRPGSLALHVDAVWLSCVDDYASCPYKFALRDLLRLPEQPRTTEYDPQRGGTALHSLWEHVWRGYAADGCRGDLVSLTTRYFDEAIRLKYPELIQSPALRRERDSLLWRAERCARLQAKLEEFLRPLRESVACEGNLPKLTVGGVSFSGRYDRLDRLKDGRFLLWDYKAGNSDSKRYRQALQLACYAQALEADHAGRCGGWGYIGLKNGGVSGFFDDDLKKALCPSGSGKATKDDRMDAAEKLMARLAAAVQTGNYPPSYDSDECDRCPYTALCRRGEFRGDYEEEEGREDE